MATEIETIRERLDEVDDRIVAILAERFKYIDELAEVKSTRSLALRDDARESIPSPSRPSATAPNHCGSRNLGR